MSEPASLAIRADGGPAVGAGHLTRCLALAQAWNDTGGRVTLATCEPPGWLASAVEGEEIDVVAIADEIAGPDDAARTAETIRSHGADWVVVDGYRFGPEYLEAIRASGARLAVVDDTAHLEHYPVDAVINQNLHASPSMYDGRSAGADLWLGTRFALLRRPFRERPQVAPAVPERVTRVLVSLGRVALPGVADRVLRALAPLAERGVSFTVLGGAPQALGALPAGFGVEYDVRDVRPLLERADLAVSAAGSTCWELAWAGVPAVLFSLADNQEPVARSLGEAGAAVNLGRVESLEPERLLGEVDALGADGARRASLSRRAAALVDGEGAPRVVMRLREDPLRLRSAREDDARQLWEWVNDPAVRASAFRSEPISWERHRAWLAGRLDDPACHWFLAYDAEDRAVGQIRFDATAAAGDAGERPAEVDVSVAPDRRGEGLGRHLIAAGTARVLRPTASRGVFARVAARVRTDNLASRRAFEAAGYEPVGEETVAGVVAVRLERAR